MKKEKSKRTWCYVLSPSKFEMPGCSCGNHNTQWSEFDNHLWCDHCRKDFIPANNGIFDGPIPMKLASLMGIHFDRFNLGTGLMEKFDLETGEYVSKNQIKIAA